MGALQAQSPLLSKGGGGRGIKAVVGVPSTTADSYLTVSLKERGRRQKLQASECVLWLSPQECMSRCCALSALHNGRQAEKVVLRDHPKRAGEGSDCDNLHLNQNYQIHIILSMYRQRTPRHCTVSIIDH